jgi:hypothetical protein
MDSTHARLRQLKEAFDEAHRHGMHALEVGDYDLMSAAIEREREIIDEQRRLLDLLRGTSGVTAAKTGASEQPRSSDS